MRSSRMSVGTWCSSTRRTRRSVRPAAQVTGSGIEVQARIAVSRAVRDNRYPGCLPRRDPDVLGAGGVKVSGWISTFTP